jgi:hypothetical protein
VRAISLWQPWATLIAIGAKSIETRSWETLHRGPIAIHAAKKWDRTLAAMCVDQPHFRKRLFAPEHGLVSEDGKGLVLPFGCIVATASLVRIERIGVSYRHGISDEEAAFGDYSPGRFAWHLRDVVKLDVPVPVRGAQGIFDLDTWVNARLTRGGRE